MPDPVAERPFAFPSDVAEALARAERALMALNQNPPSLVPLETLARRLLRAESVASSRIEGLELSQRRLARAEAVGDDARDETARSVLANIAAMERAITIANDARALEPADLDAIHGVLLYGGRASAVRTQQSWIGGNSLNRHDAAFVPLIAALPAYPILNVTTAQLATGRSKQAINEALAALEMRGVLKRVNAGKRNRAWEAPAVFDILNQFERELAMPLDGGERERAGPYPGRGHSKGGERTKR